MQHDERFFTSSHEITALLPEVGALHTATSEADYREARISTVAFLTMPPPRRAEDAVLTMPGTVTLFLAKRGSSLLDAVRRVPTADADHIRKLTGQLRQQYSGRKRVASLDAAVKQVVAQPVFAELRLHNRTLARHLFVPDDNAVCVVTLPYTGGDLAPDAFQLVEYLKEGAKETLDAVILKHDPPLSASERAALAVVGDRAVNASLVAAPCDTDLVEVVLMVLLYVALAKPADFTQWEHLTDDRIREIGAQATVRQLMEVRRQALKV